MILATALLLATPASELPFRVRRYDLTVAIDPASRRVSGEAAVEIEATTSRLEEVRFTLNRAFAVRSVEADGKPLALQEGAAIAEGRELVVTLPTDLAAGRTARLVFRYEGEGSDPGPADADWMGIVLVRADEMRMSHQAQWYPVAHEDDRALAKQAAPTRLALDLPAGLESLGPGRFLGKEPAGEGREVHVWESAAPVRASLLAGAYEARDVEEKGRTARVLAFPDHQDGARAWGREALAALLHFEKRFGKLDRPTYGIAEMRVRNRQRSYNYEADGFSVYDSVLFDGRPPDSRKIAHEVAHLWFGGALDPSGRGERFLTESLAEISAYLYVESAHGADQAEAAAQRWTERYAGNPGEEHALADTGFRSPRYAEVVYAKGPLALRALREQIGKPKFDKGLEAFIAKHQGMSPTLDDFLTAMRKAGGTKVDPWADEWLERPGLPSADR